jgi:hypothetical protein
MKRIVCEVCGSNEIVKDGDFFVCQSCGCKYTADQVKKMVIEGTVEVTGTVKVDSSDQFNNFLRLSKDSLAAKDAQAAFSYAGKALELNPKSPAAWIQKMGCIKYLATMGDLRLDEMVQYGNKAIENAEENEKQNVRKEVYTSWLKRGAELLSLAISKLNDTDAIRQLYESAKAISWTAPQFTTKADAEDVAICGAVAQSGLFLTDNVPNEGFCDFPELLPLLSDCVNLYSDSTTALVNRFKIYKAFLTEESARNRQAIFDKYSQRLEKLKQDLETKAMRAKNEKIDLFWASHEDERKQLDQEKAELEKQISSLGVSPEETIKKTDLENVRQKINGLEQDLRNIGFFHGAEKKEIQSKISAERSNEAAILESLGAFQKAREEKTSALEERIRAIDAEISEKPFK